MPTIPDAALGGQNTTTRWGRLPAWWLLHPGVDADGFCVLAALSTYADAEGWCHPSQATLARHLRRSRPWVNRVIAQLARDGFLGKTVRARENGGTTSCLYRLALEPSAVRTDTVTDATLPCPRRDAPRHAHDGNQTKPDQQITPPAVAATSMPIAAGGTEPNAPPPVDWTPSPEAVARAERTFPDVPLDGHAAMFVARCRARGYRYPAGMLDDAWLSWFMEDARRESVGGRGARGRGAAEAEARGGSTRGPHRRERGMMPAERADARLAAWAAAAAAPRVAAAGPWS